MSADSTPTMSTVTLCPPSISDGAIKLRIVKSLLRKFRGLAGRNASKRRSSAPARILGLPLLWAHLVRVRVSSHQN